MLSYLSKQLAAWRQDRDLRRTCETRLEGLPLPVPFTVPAMVKVVEELRGRRIILVPLPAEVIDPESACGLWLSLRTADVVFHEAGTTPGHQEQIVLHELSHMLFDHHGTKSLKEIQRLCPHLDLALILKFTAGVSAMGRTSYDDCQERDAEMLATLIRQRATRQLAPDDAISRLDSSLSHPIKIRKP
ncbi:toxin [Kitasatospora sp. RB6PN24]|uniref:toxin n=1 Tax=Kitasatospora humi TaxID=2893891 RepID=UPI001E2E3CBC|nr:toxin [Kitasatospora humi]MCC9309288.1 toxin [Kitasatospora humi]